MRTQSHEAGIAHNMQGNHFWKMVSLQVSNHDPKTLKLGLCRVVQEITFGNGFPVGFK